MNGGDTRAHVVDTSRRRTRLAAAPSTAPTATAIAATSRSGLTVMSKTTASAIPTLTDHDSAAAVLLMRPLMTLTPVTAPNNAIRTQAAMPTATHPVQPQATFIM